MLDELFAFFAGRALTRALLQDAATVAHHFR
jgi:hypothetical protein